MAFKRAQWHSGLTYQQTCRQCHTVVSYTDHLLDFRPWYADGFVYCPKCHTPLRHSEDYATNAAEPHSAAPIAPASPYSVANDSTPIESAESTALSLFCTACGKRFGEDDRFCSGCGAKRV